MLKQIKTVTVIGDTDNIDECLILCKKTSPNIVIAGEVDTTIIKGNITRQIKAKCPKIPVLIVTEEQRNELHPYFENTIAEKLGTSLLPYFL